MKYFLGLVLCLLNTANAAEQFSFAPEPDWLAPVEIPDANEAPLHEVQDGAHYLHFGRQDQSKAVLYLSGLDGQDESFVKGLKSYWNRSRNSR